MFRTIFLLVAFSFISLNAFANENNKNYSQFKNQKITKRKKQISYTQSADPKLRSMKSKIEPSSELKNPSLDFQLSVSDLNELSLLFPDPVTKTITKIQFPSSR
jgi:hypothetical protein